MHPQPALSRITRRILLISLFAIQWYNLTSIARAQLVVTTGGGNPDQQSIYVLQGFPDISNLCQYEVAGLPAFVHTANLSFAGSDTALAGFFGTALLMAIQVSTGTISGYMDMTTFWNGQGTVAASPAGDYALCSGAEDKLVVVKAPFNSSSVITSIALPAHVPPYQSEAIQFDSSGRAFVYTTNLTDGFISVLNKPYTSIAFNIPVPGNLGGTLSLSPDGNTILATLQATGGKVDIFHAPFSASSTPEVLTVGLSSTSAYLDPVRISPNGTMALVAERDTPHLYTIAAPFNSASAVQELPLPSSLSIGFEAIDFSADGQNAAATGFDDGTKREPLLLLKAPFTPAGVITRAMDVGVPPENGRGGGTVRFRRSAAPPASLAIYKTAPVVTKRIATPTFPITVANNTKASVANVVVRETVPAGCDFVSADNGGTFSGGQISWNLGSMAAGAKRNVSFIARITKEYGYLTNQTYSVQAGSASAIPGPATNSYIARGSIEALAPATLLAGSTITYTINASNNSSAAIHHAKINDTLPAGLTFLSASNGGTLESGMVVWSLETMDANAAISFTVTARTPTTPQVLINQSYTFTADEWYTPERGLPVRTQLAPILTVANSGPASANSGAIITYTLTCKNNGPAAVSSVVVQDPIPAGTSFYSATPGAYILNNVVNFPVGTMAAGASATLTLRVKITAASGHIVNQAYTIAGSSTGGTGGSAVYTLLQSNRARHWRSYR